MLFKQQSEEMFIGHVFSCVVISNICVFSRFIMALLYDTLLILIFVIMFFVTLEEQEAV